MKCFLNGPGQTSSQFSLAKPGFSWWHGTPTCTRTAGNFLEVLCFPKRLVQDSRNGDFFYPTFKRVHTWDIGGLTFWLKREIPWAVGKISLGQHLAIHRAGWVCWICSLRSEFLGGKIIEELDDWNLFFISLVSIFEAYTLKQRFKQRLSLPDLSLMCFERCWTCSSFFMPLVSGKETKRGCVKAWGRPDDQGRVNNRLKPRDFRRVSSFCSMFRKARPSNHHDVTWPAQLLIGRWQAGLGRWLMRRVSLGMQIK